MLLQLPPGLRYEPALTPPSTSSSQISSPLEFAELNRGSYGRLSINLSPLQGVRSSPSPDFAAVEAEILAKKACLPTLFEDTFNQIGWKTSDDRNGVPCTHGRCTKILDENGKEVGTQKSRKVTNEFAYLSHDQKCEYPTEIGDCSLVGTSSGGYAFAEPTIEGRELDLLGSKLEALDTLNLDHGSLLDVDKLVSIAQECSLKSSLKYAEILHVHVCSRGLEGDVLVANHLIRMFVTCGSIPIAEKVFVRLELRIEQSWTFLISGYVQSKRFADAFKLYQKMLEDCVQPSSYTVVTLLKACIGSNNIEKGRALHNEIRQSRISTELHVGNTLVGMYANSGYLGEAEDVFDHLVVKTVVSWTALIAGYADHGPTEEAYFAFLKMQQDGITPNDVTFACVLKACGSLRSVSMGQEIHADAIAKGVEETLLVGNSLIDMYAKCGSCEEAQEIFDKLPVRDVISWTALIAGYAESGFGEKALDYYNQMEGQGVPRNAVTVSCAIKACNSIGDIERGRNLHLEAVQEGFEDNLFVGNSLAGMYARYGSLVEAREVFDSMMTKDVVSWTALTSGYAEHGPGQEAVKLFEQMLQEGVSANRVAFSCALKACGSVGAIYKGFTIHGEVVKQGLENDPIVAHTLISMYARCCSLTEARDVFDKLACFDVVAWSTMIKGYGLNHEGGKAIQCFESMQSRGVQPNAVTFTCLLAACSHASLVVSGHNFFKCMREDYGVSPLAEHYACMVDLFARSGHLYEAERFLESLCPPSKETWGALLTACKTVGDVELGYRCFQELIKLDKQDGTWYVIMSDTYANVGMWDDAYRIDELRRRAGAYKKPAIAVIEVNQKFHEFVAGHMERKEVICMLQYLKLRVRGEGHSPSAVEDSRCMFDEENLIANEGDSLATCEHAEKVAIAFGILNLPQGETLRVSKNLRMCNDCHTTSRILSKTEKREIIIQDNCCIHHFKSGLCSCGDMY